MSTASAVGTGAAALLLLAATPAFASFPAATLEYELVRIAADPVALDDFVAARYGAVPVSQIPVYSGYLADAMSQPGLAAYLMARTEPGDGEAVAAYLDRLGTALPEDAVRAGTRRLPVEDLEALFSVRHDLVRWAADNDPSACPLIGDVEILPAAEVEQRYLATLSPEELEGHLAILVAAIRAEIADAPPATVFAVDETGAAKAARDVAVEAALAAAPNGPALQAALAGTAGDPRDICLAQDLVFTAIESLPLQERGAAIYEAVTIGH